MHQTTEIANAGNNNNSTQNDKKSEGSMNVMMSGGIVTKNALAQTKNEMYDYLNIKLTEIHNTYS